jgi:hypothetical protein
MIEVLFGVEMFAFNLNYYWGELIYREWFLDLGIR